MSTHITCPNCQHRFALEEVLTEDVEKSLKGQYEQRLRESMEKLAAERQALVSQQQAFEEKKLRENELFTTRLEKERQRIQQELQEQVRRSVAGDYEQKLAALQQAVVENEEKLRASRQQELVFLRKEKELQEREAELELQLQKQLLAERERLREQVVREEYERIQLKESEYQLRMREMEKQLNDQKKLVDEMRRKAEQGSMQLQGEVQELWLEEILQTTFPFDRVEEVRKGARGADCIQTVRNRFGTEVGRIIYESKRTKEFSLDWIEKLKSDMRGLGADMAVIVTQAFPKDMDRFGEKDGVYISNFSEVRGVALLLRHALLKIFDVRKSGENRGDKMAMLYDYLTGHEFSEQWKAIREGFMSMKQSIQKERDAMERLWKAREKQLEKVLLNAAHVRGCVDGIAGTDTVNLSLADDADALLLE